jgi:hypothetical protein
VKQTAVLIATPRTTAPRKVDPHRKWREKRLQIHPHDAEVVPVKSA